MRQKAAFLLFPLALGGPTSQSKEEEDVLLRALVSWPASSTTNHSDTPLPVQDGTTINTNGTTSSSSFSSSTLTATLDRRVTKEKDAKPTLHPSEHNLELCCLLQYASASCLSELESGTLLSTCNEGSVSSSDAYLVTRARERQCFVYPVEQGRYVAAFTLPHGLCSSLTQAGTVSFLVATALRGYAIDAATATSSAPLYRSLHARLQDNAEAVQKTMHTQLTRLVHAVRAAEKQSGAPLHARRLAATLRCMCHEQTCIVRTGCQVHQRLHRLLHDAFSPTASAALAGRVSSYGMMAAERRFLIAGHALWYAGHPLHSSSSSSSLSGSRLFADYLLPIALAATITQSHEEGTMHRNTEGTSVTSEVYMAMASPWQRAAETAACWSVGGYIESVDTTNTSKDYKDDDTVSVDGVLGFAMCGVTGWTLALLLRPVTLDFAPAAMTLPQIVSRVKTLVCGETLGKMDLQGLRETSMSSSTSSRPQRTVSLFSPATTGVLGRIRELFVMRRAVGRITASQPRESCLLYLNTSLAKVLLDSPPRALGSALLVTPNVINEHDQSSEATGDSPGYWYRRRYGPRVTQLLQCATRLARPGMSLSQYNTLFAVLRREPREDSLLVHAAPLAATPGIVYVVAEVQGGETEAVATGELRCFTTWLLAKVM